MKQSWILRIGAIATIILLFTDQIIRMTYMIENDGILYLTIAYVYIAALFTTLDGDDYRIIFGIRDRGGIRIRNIRVSEVTGN